MSDILTEYIKRHNLPLSISPITEGSVFFECNNKKFIVLISSISKSFHFCKECYDSKNSNSTIMEILTLEGFQDTLTRIVHVHYDHEFDIISEFKKYIGNNCSPIAIDSTRKLEEFIWNFYVDVLHENQPHIMRYRKNWIDEMLFLSIKHSNVFERYYINLYSPIIINRKYLYK